MFWWFIKFEVRLWLFTQGSTILWFEASILSKSARPSGPLSSAANRCKFDFSLTFLPTGFSASYFIRKYLKKIHEFSEKNGLSFVSYRNFPLKSTNGTFAIWCSTIIITSMCQRVTFDASPLSRIFHPPVSRWLLNDSFFFFSYDLILQLSTQFVTRGTDNCQSKIRDFVSGWLFINQSKTFLAFRFFLLNLQKLGENKSLNVQKLFAVFLANKQFFFFSNAAFETAKFSRSRAMACSGPIRRFYN